MKKRLFGFLKKIDKLSPKTWFFLVFIFLCLFQFAMYPEPLRSNYIYAEDAGVFTNDFEREGIAVLMKPFAGYFVLLSRIFGVIAVSVARFFNNFNLIGTAFSVLSMIFIAFVGAYFVSDRFKFLIKSRLRRLITMLIVFLLLACLIGMYFASVCIHWWCGIFMFLISLELISGKMPPKYTYPVIIIAALSSPSAFILGLGVLYWAGKTIFVDKKAKTLLKGGSPFFLFVTLFPLALQAFIIVFGNQSTEATSSGLALSHLAETARATYESALSIPLFSFTFNLFSSLGKMGIAPIAGGAIWLAIIIVAKKQKLLKYVIFTAICTIFIYILTYYKRTAPVDFYQTMAEWGMFYHAVPVVATFILISTIWAKIPRKKEIILIEAAFLLVIVPHIRIERYKMYSWKNQELIEANEYLDFNSDTAALVHTPPFPDYEWFQYVLVPVKAEYCQKENIICEKI